MAVPETNIGKLAFSILERIVVVETSDWLRADRHSADLSVSSNGSWWLKQEYQAFLEECERHFQYPRTDRGG